MFENARLTVTFLLGSGISKPAGMPLAHDITERILSGENVQRDSQGVYRLDCPHPLNPPQFPEEYVWRVKEFLRALWPKLGEWHLPLNYEGLYQAASTIRSRADGQVPEFTQAVPARLLHPLEGGLVEEWNPHDLAMEAMHYIADVCWALLTRKPKSLHYLDAIVGACRDGSVGQVNIFTLNHDTVLEQCLDSNGVSYTDGFGQPEGPLRYWKPELFDTEASMVRLLKLHGSVDWFERAGSSPDTDLVLAIQVKVSSGPAIEGPDGVDRIEQRPRPLFLTGIDVKTRQYNGRFFREVHGRFRQRMLKGDQPRRLVVSGYGFCDTGINHVLQEWLKSSPDHRPVLVHKEPSTLPDVELLHERAIVIPRWIEDTSWASIRAQL